jgi:uncharacterized membrane protein
MNGRTSITVFGSQEDVERLWSDASRGPTDPDASVEFRRASGGRGTEIHIQIADRARLGKLGAVVQRLGGSDPLAHAKDELRRFKQLVETGVIARSDSTPGGERVDAKLRQRPAQPLADSDRERAAI